MKIFKFLICLFVGLLGADVFGEDVVLNPKNCLNTDGT